MIKMKVVVVMVYQKRVMKICQFTVMRFEVLAKNIKKKLKEVESEDDCEELKSECGIDEESGSDRKKYLDFKFPKKHVSV